MAGTPRIEPPRTPPRRPALPTPVGFATFADIPRQRRADHRGDSDQGQDSAEEISAIDARRFRGILGHFATGVVAITAIDPETGRPTGLAANSFTSVSLDPALVSFCVAHTSTTWPRLRMAERHCVNILSAPQRDVCLQFASSGGEKFAGLEWSESPSGEPVIDGALAWLECSVEAEHVAGDHVIVVARVHHLDRHDDGDPLVFYRGCYGTFAATSRTGTGGIFGESGPPVPSQELYSPLAASTRVTRSAASPRSSAGAMPAPPTTTRTTRSRRRRSRSPPGCSPRGPIACGFTT